METIFTFYVLLCYTISLSYHFILLVSLFLSKKLFNKFYNIYYNLLLVEKKNNSLYRTDVIDLLTMSLLIPFISLPLILMAGLHYDIVKAIKKEFGKV